MPDNKIPDETFINISRNNRTMATGRRRDTDGSSVTPDLTQIVIAGSLQRIANVLEKSTLSELVSVLEQAQSMKWRLTRLENKLKEYEHKEGKRSSAK